MNALVCLHILGCRGGRCREWPAVRLPKEGLSALIRACATRWGYSASMRLHLPADLRPILVAGVRAGFTTISAFSLEIGLLH
jgi:fluoride ion exporter CrcB/FEX